MVTVVIPYYNRADTIDETIESLRVQSYTNFEVLLVNDGSTDPVSTEKLSHLGVGKLDIKIINQKNQGVAVARNTGIKKAKGRYVICLDSDDTLDQMYIEKCLLVLETNPNVDLVFSDMRMFGVTNTVYKQAEYSATELTRNNMVTTAAMFRKECWDAVGGYKADIGYEDWEYWINLAEHGFWGYKIPEPIFNYRTAITSRYVDDKAKHKLNVRRIKAYHTGYTRHIRKLRRAKYYARKTLAAEELFTNLDNPEQYAPISTRKPHILVVSPWMTFGGAETLIHNYCRELRDDFTITFITTHKSEHEWEYKFKEISTRIYHISNLFKDADTTLEFISSYVDSRKVDVIHLVHTDSLLNMLPALKSRHPQLKALLTLFNDRIPKYMGGAVKYQKYLDGYVSDNSRVASVLKGMLDSDASIMVLPNGIDCYNEFNHALFNVDKQRAKLGIAPDELAVFFVGRLSEEKNPDVFVRVADSLSQHKEIKFFVIGDGPMRTDIERDIVTAKARNIEYLGYQSDIASYLSAADIFVLPSSVEGFPLSIIEAMAMRVVVIASDVGAVSEVIESGVDGFVVEPGNVLAITEAIKKLVHDSGKVDSIKDKARDKVEKKYSNRTLGANYKKLYRKVIR